MDIWFIWRKLFKQIFVSFVAVCSARIILFTAIVTVMFWLQIMENLYPQVGLQIVFVIMQIVFVIMQIVFVMF